MHQHTVMKSSGSVLGLLETRIVVVTEFNEALNCLTPTRTVNMIMNDLPGDMIS